MNKNNHCIVMAGNLCDGFRVFGPFNDFDEACEWCEENEHLFLGTWVMSLENPTLQGEYP